MTLSEFLDEHLDQHELSDQVIRQLREYPADELLAQLSQRFVASEKLQNVFVQNNIFEICATVIGKPAGQFIAEVSTGPISNFSTQSFCRALSKCSIEGGFDIAARKLQNEVGHQRALTAHALLEFDEGSKILDWIESLFVESNETVKPDWGQLAALAGITWARICKWLDLGKPINLIALDAMKFCWDYDAGIGAWLHNYEPKLLEPTDKTEMKRHLLGYVDKESSPRVALTVEAIVQHLDS